jgi:hypothetical protein
MGAKMTTIAVRSGCIAADSRTTTHSEEGGARVFRCEKLYRKRVITPETGGVEDDVILATAGETFSALVFVDWYGSQKEKPGELIDGDADFSVLVLSRKGLFEFDRWCRGEKILDRFYAVGSGAKAALGAMHMGATVTKAVYIACKIDPFSAPPVTTWSLPERQKVNLPRSSRSARRQRSGTPVPQHHDKASSTEPAAPADRSSPSP